MAKFQGIEDFMTPERSFIPYTGRVKYIINPRLRKLPNARVLGTNSEGEIIAKSTISRDLYNPFGMYGEPVLFKSIAGGNSNTAGQINWNFDFSFDTVYPWGTGLSVPSPHKSTIHDPSIYTIPPDKDLVIFSCNNAISCKSYNSANTTKWARIRSSNSISSIIPGSTWDPFNTKWKQTQVMIDPSGSHAFSIPTFDNNTPNGPVGTSGGAHVNWTNPGYGNLYNSTSYLTYDTDMRLMSWTGMLCPSGYIPEVKPIMELGVRDFLVPPGKDLVITSSGFAQVASGGQNTHPGPNGGVFIVQNGTEFLLREPNEGIRNVTHANAHGTIDPTQETHHYFDGVGWTKGTSQAPAGDLPEKSGSLTPSVIPSGSTIRVKDDRGGWCGYLLDRSVYTT